MMGKLWDATYYDDASRRRLVPCFDLFYGTVVELVRKSCPPAPRLLDLGTGTGLLAQAVVEKLGVSRLCLLDSSDEMIAHATHRLAAWAPEIYIQSLISDLPAGPYDAIVSALAIHHLTHEEKKSLFTRVFRILSPGGIFVNAEQVLARSLMCQRIFEDIHLAQARALGSPDEEIASAVLRMQHDQCATVAEQLSWLEMAGFADVECFFQSFRFAVYGGWRIEG